MPFIAFLIIALFRCGPSQKTPVSAPPSDTDDAIGSQFAFQDPIPDRVVTLKEVLPVAATCLGGLFALGYVARVVCLERLGIGELGVTHESATLVGGIIFGAVAIPLIIVGQAGMAFDPKKSPRLAVMCALSVVGGVTIAKTVAALGASDLDGLGIIVPWILGALSGAISFLGALLAPVLRQPSKSRSTEILGLLLLTLLLVADAVVFGRYALPALPPALGGTKGGEVFVRVVDRALPIHGQFLSEDDFSVVIDQQASTDQIGRVDRRRDDLKEHPIRVLKLKMVAMSSDEDPQQVLAKKVFEEGEQAAKRRAEDDQQLKRVQRMLRPWSKPFTALNF